MGGGKYLEKIKQALENGRQTIFDKIHLGGQVRRSIRWEIHVTYNWEIHKIHSVVSRVRL